MAMFAGWAGCARPDEPRAPLRNFSVSSDQQLQALCNARGPADVASLHDTASGAAIEFSTDGDNVGELRERVRSVLERAPAVSNPSARAAGGGTDAVVVRDTPSGVQIRIMATAPSRIAEVRQQARTQLQRMARGDCPD
jgi:hypothetical protein